MFSWREDYRREDYHTTDRSCRTSESDKQFIVFVEAPGLEAKDFKISVSGSHLTLEYPTANIAQPELTTYTKNIRTAILPVGSDLSAITANYKAGILTVVVPKRDNSTGIINILVQ